MRVCAENGSFYYPASRTIQDGRQPQKYPQEKISQELTQRLPQKHSKCADVQVSILSTTGTTGHQPSMGKRVRECFVIRACPADIDACARAPYNDAFKSTIT